MQPLAVPNGKNYPSYTSLSLELDLQELTHLQWP